MTVTIACKGSLSLNLVLSLIHMWHILFYCVDWLTCLMLTATYLWFRTLTSWLASWRNPTVKPCRRKICHSKAGTGALQSSRVSTGQQCMQLNFSSTSQFGWVDVRMYSPKIRFLKTFEACLKYHCWQVQKINIEKILYSANVLELSLLLVIYFIKFSEKYYMVCGVRVELLTILGEL